MAQLYVSKKDESARMFKSDFIEFFTHVHPATPLVIFGPAIICMLYVALWQRGLSILVVAGLFLLGVFFWTLIEYVIHRYAFHHEAKTRIGKQFHFIVHGVHHDYPNDARRLASPPVVSIPLAIAFYGAFFLIFGRLAPGVWAGLVAGYVCYDSIHYAIHHFPMKAGILHRLKQHHLRHHYHDDHSGYGVSSPLWDYVFRTNRR